MAVVNISGRQYKVEPKKQFNVDFLGDLKEFECSEVLLLASDKKTEIGTPFLKEKIVFDVLGSSKEKKIRVAKFHAKANTRKVTGSRRMISTLVVKSI